MKVSGIYRIMAFVLLGVVLGMFVTIKFLVPPTTEISIGKIKLKGNDNTVKDVFTITPEDGTLIPGDLDGLSKKELRKERRQENKDIRQQDRAIKKAARKRSRMAYYGYTVHIFVDS